MLWYDKKEGVVSMDYQERLKNLPPEVMTAFSESFIFLISNDKVQHFTARDLTQAEMIQRVKEKLGEAVTWSLWQGFVIAVNSEKTCVAVLPKYHQLDGF
ncbi:hypothetical protein P0E39_00170 [Enterococcus faecalis]|uniref:hypothetical protein n=1 Tax=Enterococcus faecalis TaxID=1351 RepID=UPI0025B249A9|nr:hypothetical protein [Enterococcus faecalis]MDN3093140.1 hypothetical protein [Enterococcus faecalis]